MDTKFILIVNSILLYNACPTLSKCTAGRILGVTSDGTGCDVYGKSYNNSAFWNKCIRIKDGVPSIDGKSETAHAQRLTSFIERENITFIDFFTAERPDGGVTKQKITVGMGYQKEAPSCFIFDQELNDYKIFFCDKFGVSNPLKGHKIDCVEKIFSPDGSADYIIYCYQPLSNGALFVVNQKTNESIEFSQPKVTFNAITYLGPSRRGLPLIGGVTKNEITIIYEFENGRLDTIVDYRLSDHLNGCPQKMCLEGDIDSIYSLSIESNNESAIYFTRKNHLYKLEEKNEKIDFIIKIIGTRNEHACDTAFVLWNESLEPKVFYVIDDKIISQRIANYSRDQFFPQIGKDDKIFASFHIKNEGAKNAAINYYMFSGGKIYEYAHKGNLTLEFIKSFPIEGKFDRLWKTFDAAFMYKNYVYFFNQDYNVRYEWKVDGLLTPDGDPQLNQKTWWTCNHPELYEKLLYKPFGLNDLDDYYENIVRKYRYIPLRTESSLKNQTSKKSKSNFNWPILIISLLVVMIVVVVMALFSICRSRPKKTTNETKTATTVTRKVPMRGKKKAMKDDSFVSQTS